MTGFSQLEYPDRLRKLNLFPLAYRRSRGDLIYTWRILQGKLGDELRENYQVMTGKILRGHKLKLFKPRRNKLAPGITLSTRVVNLWNSLPAEIAEAVTEDSFKAKLDRHLLATTR